MVYLLNQKNASDIVLYDNTSMDTRLSEYTIIVSAQSTIHTHVLCNHAVYHLKKFNIPIFHRDGQYKDSWIVLDCAVLMLHLFTPEVRKKYFIEELHEDECRKLHWKRYSFFKNLKNYE